MVSQHHIWRYILFDQYADWILTLAIHLIDKEIGFLDKRGTILGAKVSALVLAFIIFIVLIKEGSRSSLRLDLEETSSNSMQNFFWTGVVQHQSWMALVE